MRKGRPTSRGFACRQGRAGRRSKSLNAEQVDAVLTQTAPDRLHHYIVVSLLTRPAPLQQDIVWSFYAGPGGAISANRSAGLSVTVPPGALSQNVRITVKVKAGNVYDYQFAPEGLQFAKPVVVTQDVSNNSLLGGVLGGLLGSSQSPRGAYYVSPTLQYDPATGKATVNELEPTITGAGYVSFSIRHFSGYTIAMCGNGGGF